MNEATLTIMIDLAATGWDGDDLGLRWTMACSNDVIQGVYNPIPEPGTLLLFGAGLLGLAGYGRRRTR